MSRSRMRVYVPLIRKFAARVVLFHAAVAERLGLNSTDLHALRLLGEAPMTAGALAEQTGLTGAAVTALIDRLERVGFVTRERSTRDRRSITVRAEPRKLREMVALYRRQGARMEKLFSRYSAVEFRAVADFLEQTAVVLAEEAKQLGEASGRRQRH